MNDVLYEGMIPLNPKTKKNSQEILYKHIYSPKGVYSKTRGILKYLGVPFISQSKAYKQYEADAGWFLRWRKPPINEPVNVKCIFYRDSERRCDQTNLLEAIDDILVKYGILADDNFKIIVSHDGSRVKVDKKKPRTEIVITKANDI